MKKIIKKTADKLLDEVKSVSKIEAVFMVALFIVPVPGTLEIYIAGRTAVKKFVHKKAA